MKRIVIAVLLSLAGPGLGQIYNKEYKKGIALLVVSGALFLLPLFWLIGKVAPSLPDPEKTVITQEMVQDAAMKVIGEDKHILNLVSFAFLGLWAYAITQAYFKAKEIHAAQTPADETDKESPEGTP